MHSPPLLAPRPMSDALHRAHWQRTVAGYIVDVIEPLAMLAVIGVAFRRRSGDRRQVFLVVASIALALTAERRLNNAITAWTDLMDLDTYAWLASVMWVPTVAAWIVAWNHWGERPWRVLDGIAVVLALAGIAGAEFHAPGLTTTSRLGAIAAFIVLGARVGRAGPSSILALVTMLSIVAGLFGAELLDPLGVPGIWFPFGIGVSRTQYIYAIAIPLLAILIVRTWREDTAAVTFGATPTS